MIKVNDIVISPSTFGDGTLKCEAPEINSSDKEIFITWCYDNDAELFCVYSLAKYLRENSTAKISLVLPYIPHARQDRYVSNRLFTLKYFAEIINLVGFYKVYALDPHSDVSFKLINNLEELPLPFQVSLGTKDFNNKAIMFPDKGAAAKYEHRYVGLKMPFIIGEKHRNSEGRIDRYELKNFTPGTKSVVIRDDICSYGGTFVSAAKELRKLGVEDITLVVSHCENNILKGEVFDYIDRVFTTDSICTAEHPKLIVTKAYR